MTITARDLIYKNKLEDIISVSNEKNLSPSEVEWMFLMKKAKDLGLSIKDVRSFIVQNQQKPLPR
ncbi:anti-repressor SinI family protein [Bacillus megaterium]|nr:anti-repressor SinI family protein [Priestia megaterium]